MIVIVNADLLVKLFYIHFNILFSIDNFENYLVDRFSIIDNHQLMNDLLIGFIGLERNINYDMINFSHSVPC